MKKIIPLLVVIGLLAAPTAVVFAQLTGGVPLPGGDQTNLGTSADGVVKFVCGLFSYVFMALLLAAVAFVLLAAYRYLTAAGDPAKITTANKTLIFAAVAIAVALLARAVPVIVGSFVLSPGSSGQSGFDVCASYSN